MHFHNDIKSMESRESSLHNVTQTAAWGSSPYTHSYPIYEMDPQGHGVTLITVQHM